VEEFGTGQDPPYLKRWMLIVCGLSFRLHHWMKSDDDRHFHDHSCDFISIVLSGGYINVTPTGSQPFPAGSIWRSRADRRHYLRVPPGGAWSLLLCGRPYRKWGFYVNGRRMRPWKYFRRYGVRQNSSYQ
jgi:hypothetical protein